MKISTSLLALFVAATVTACAGSGGAPAPSGGGTRAAFCKSGDQQVKSASQCLQDDAACYQLTSGAWCTGERGLSCPTGSSEIAKGAPCPRGARCFEAGEGLSCAVNY